MALINCPQCGHMISDKAKACPKCGYVLNNEQAKPVENIDDEESESQFDDCTPQQGGGLKWILIVLAILVIGGGVGYYFYADNKAKKEIALAAEQARLDSIEAARLDSIRQDSIARRNFTSPDLAFHDLHGDVKKCVVDNNEYETYTFDENGKWTNEPQWDEYDKKYCPDKTKHPRVERNAEGYIIRIYNECGASCEYESVIWEGGKVKTNSISTYKYDNDGLAISREDIREYESGTDGAVYCNYVLDDMGNWIKRDVIYKLYSIDINDDEKIEYSKSTETRDITYYKSNNGGSAQRPNNTIQGQALQNLKDFAQQKEQDEKKGPEWINGIWECHEMVDLGYFGRQRANARLCIDRENQMVSSNNDGEKYNGRYTISGNEIHFGSWYADLDNSRERIEFGKGVYYRKVSSSYTYGSSSNSCSGSSGSRSSYSGSSRTSFSSPSDVLSYTSSNSFYNGGDRLRIGFDAVYLNGTALTGAPRVTNISGSSATIIASNPYGGRALHFYVNASSGTITQNGDVYRAR